MKAQQRQSATKTHGRGHLPNDGRAKTHASASKLDKLYSRLDQTKPGTKESKQIADEIIDAIG